MRWRRPQAVDDQQPRMRPSHAQNKKNRPGFDFLQCVACFSLHELCFLFQLWRNLKEKKDALLTETKERERKHERARART
jgi:hypothetical protein